jgi:trk system potassium uptake protein
MRVHVILRYLGLVFLLNAFFLFLSFLLAWHYNDSGFYALLYSTAVTFLMGVFPLIFVPPSSNLSQKEGYVVVVLSWILSCVVGTFPYVIWGGEFSFTNAWFESVSGFTTTGGTVLSDVEALPRSLLFWRASTHWIGGVGIVLFVLVILPSILKVKVSLYKFEMSSLAMDNFRFRARKVMSVVLWVYIGLTVAEIILLCLCGMGIFDAVCHSFATIATGGFSTKNMSISYFHSFPIELVIMVFMLLSGIHFGLLYSVFSGNVKALFRSEIVRFYLISTVIGIFIVALNVYGKNYDTLGESFRYASFQLISLSTSTGFATAGSEVWPPLAILVLIYFTMQTACSGSTAGGIKVDRILLFMKNIKRQMTKMMHPNAVIPIHIDGISVKDDVIESAVSFIVFYLFIVVISAALLCGMGVDILSAFSGAAACMGNVGPGFAHVSSLGNYSTIPEVGKWILSADMLLGRLEIYGLLMLFGLRSWK